MGTNSRIQTSRRMVLCTPGTQVQASVLRGCHFVAKIHLVFPLPGRGILQKTICYVDIMRTGEIGLVQRCNGVFRVVRFSTL